MSGNSDARVAIHAVTLEWDGSPIVESILTRSLPVRSLHGKPAGQPVPGRAVAIPAGSFTRVKGRFKFEGVINGVKLEAVLRPLILGNDYEFTLKGKSEGAELSGIENPVTVGLIIGDDSGSKTITAIIE